MNKKRFAYTLAEILIAMMVLAFLVVVTIMTLNRPEAIREKKILTLSHSFLSASENVYQQIVFHHTTSKRITSLIDANGDSTINSDDLLEYFVKYMDGQKYTEAPAPTEEDASGATGGGDDDDDDEEDNINACREIQGEGNVATYFEAARCANFPPDIVAGVYLDTNCSTSLEAKEFYDKDDKSSRAVSNACGYIIYGFRDSKGILGEDVFTIPLGKVGIKH